MCFTVTCYTLLFSHYSNNKHSHKWSTNMAVEVRGTNQNKFYGVNRKDYIYEDDQCVVFDELNNPQAPVHYVVVPKARVPRLFEAKGDDEKILGHLLLVAEDIAASRGLRAGYHVTVDEEPGARASRLKAIHVFGRALHHMLWPVGPGSRL